MKKSLACLALAAAATAMAVFAATVQCASAATGGSMTPFVEASPAFALDGAVDPTLQAGTLRACQKRSVPTAVEPNGACYGPDQIRVAYGVQPLLDAGITGAGRTIVIIDAYGSDTLASDLAFFDAWFGLPGPALNVIAPFGVASTTAKNAAGWKGETTLDVEWAHSIAPGATIDLVIARSNDASDILDATQYVADHDLGDVVSQSYGEAEQCMDAETLARQHRIFDQLVSEGITLFASSGDQGAGLPTCDNPKALFKAASSPATDPDVTAVGGTQLIASPPTADATNHVASVGGNYMSESVWNERVGSSGGSGISTVYSRPDYQASIVKDSRMREIPDISYNAAVNGGVLGVYTCEVGDPNCQTGPSSFVVGQLFFRFGGTSAGSPQWAALIALTDQLANGRIGGINKTLYHLGKRGDASSLFHDVTVGDNSVAFDKDVPGTPIAGFSATAGWDAATGWGTPIASALVPALAAPGQG